MYTNFFALSEQPFSIAPNPKYLFMSDRHREALVHLSYGLGISDSDIVANSGFVLLTGEVGTGKTTVSRYLMEQLPENTQVAFILNPTLSSQELLATICDQLKIRYRKNGATLKTLTDKISEKLLKNHDNDINTLLIIDEAQHLQPEVLEQLRLLTNLETNTKKLLQVILIGQPELQQLLQRRDLRQLAQRITARYHLLPLNKEELSLYIKHRLSVADCHRPLFSKSAIAMIHRLTQGIPRLTNLLCHKALMNAYNSNNALVSKKIVLHAAEQALGEEYLPKFWWQYASLKVAMVASVLVAVLLSGYWLGQSPADTQIVQVLIDNVDQEKASDFSESTIDIEPKLTVQPVEIAAVNVAVDDKTTVQEKSVQAAKTIAENEQVPEKQLLVDSQSNTQKFANVKFNVTPTVGVSDELLAKFQSAIDESNTEQATMESDEVSSNTNDVNSSKRTDSHNSNLRTLMEMPQWVQNGVPPLEFEQHIYATDGAGWVRVNGKDRIEGEFITADLTLTEILPQQVILTYRGELFSLPALTNW